LNFTNKYGGKDWKGWHTQYDQIEEEWKNLLAVFDWCAVHDRYNEMCNFWQREVYWSLVIVTVTGVIDLLGSLGSFVCLMNVGLANSSGDDF